MISFLYHFVMLILLAIVLWHAVLFFAVMACAVGDWFNNFCEKTGLDKTVRFPWTKP